MSLASARPSTFVLTAPGPARIYSLTELLRLPPPTWLIDGFLPKGGFIGVYGPPENGKSFLAIDWAMSIAAGGEWQGHPCGPGAPVLYISAEGGTGIAKRAQAWLQARHVAPRDCPIMWMIEPIPLHSQSTDVDALLTRIEDEVPTPALVVIDTLARCFEGDENTQEDMGRFVAGVDLLRQKWQATALVIHHTRLDGDRERGNTSFRGATDTMVDVKGRHKIRGRERLLVGLDISCTKQRDAPGFAPVRLRVSPVEGTESCVVDSAICTPSPGVGRPSAMSARQARLLNFLKEWGSPIIPEDWKVGTGLPKSTFYREISSMENAGLIQQNSEGLWVLIDPQSQNY